MLRYFRGKKKNRGIALLCAAALLMTSAALLVLPALAAPGDLAKLYKTPFEGYLNLPLNTPLEFIGPGSFQWRSSNPTVVSVVQDPSDPEVAIVTGIAAGFATVVNSTRSGVANMRNFVVVDNSKISGYRIPGGANGGYLAKADDTLQIDVKVWKGAAAPTGNNVNLIVANAAPGDIAWTSSDESVATVTSNGLITAKSIGAVMLQGELTDPWGALQTISYFVNVGVNSDSRLQDLVKAIEEAKKVRDDPAKKWTPESKKRLDDAIAKGEDVKNHYPDVSADDISDAIRDIEDAIRGMEEIDIRGPFLGKYYYELKDPRKVWVECDQYGNRRNNGNIIYVPYGDFPPAGAEGDDWFDKDSGHVQDRGGDGYWYTPDNGVTWIRIGGGPGQNPTQNFTSVPAWQNFTMYVGDPNVVFNFTKIPADSTSFLSIAVVSDNDHVAIRGVKHNEVRALTEGKTTIKVVDESGRQIGNQIEVTVLTRVPDPASVTVYPTFAEVEPTGEQAFTATVLPADALQDVTWTVTGRTSFLTDIDANGVLTVGVNEIVGTTLTITATTVNGLTKTATVLVVDIPVRPFSISVNPDSVALTPNQTQLFDATVYPYPNVSQDVIWKVEGNASTRTKIDVNGLLTVGSNEEIGTVLTVTATSVLDDTVFDTAEVVIVSAVPDPVKVEIDPATADVMRGSSQHFLATVYPYPDALQSVIWTVTGKTSAGTYITQDGWLYVASDEALKTLTVTATTTAAPAKSASATVTVRPQGSDKIPWDGNPGDKFKVDGEEWIIIKKDGSGNMLITTTRIIATVKYNKNNRNDYGPSNLKSVMDNYYTSNKWPTLFSFVKTATIPIESQYSTSATNAVSVVSAASTTRVFALSISDINTSWISTQARRPAAGGEYWLRSPGEKGSPDDVATVKSNGAYYDERDANCSYGVRPAMWIGR